MNNQFWNHIFALSSAIEQTEEKAESSLAQIKGQLETIDVLYQRTFDPADNYQEYVTVALCKAVNKMLSRNSPTGNNRR